MLKPTIGAELAEKGVLAVICALFAIMVYIWFRFEWQFSLAALIALSHDVITTIGIFALTNLRLIGLLFRHNLLVFSFNYAVIPIVNVEIGVD